MSLKAKLEAVVYAAEEPVTLSLLATMFAEEVLQILADAPGASTEPPAEQIELLAIDPVAEVAAEGAAEGAGEAPSTQEAVAEEALTADASVGQGASAAEGDLVDEKKMARQRDRQIRQLLQTVMDDLIKDYASSDRGMEIREIAGGYRMATKPEYHDAVRVFVKSLKPPMKLSLQALETLAVIAYKQPVTAPEVSEIRGVDSGGVLGGLVSRKLISTAGRKQVIGRPILYKTTKEFLLRFGLKDVNDLPSVEEFEKMAGELAETESEGEAQDAALPSTEPLVPHLEGAAEGVTEQSGDNKKSAEESGMAEVSASEVDHDGTFEEAAIQEESLPAEGDSPTDEVVVVEAEDVSANEAHEAGHSEAGTDETQPEAGLATNAVHKEGE